MSFAQTEIKTTPFVKWAGGKKQLLPKIIEKMPKTFNRYYEPFIGGGALFFNLQPDGAVINDNNEALINLYKYVKEDPQGLIDYVNVFDKTISEMKGDDEAGKAYYYELRELFNKTIASGNYDIESAALFMFINKHCFNGLYRVNSKGMFNVPFNKSYGPSMVEENILNCSKYLQDVSIRNVDFEEACIDCEKGDFVFFDSPYAPLNPTSFTSYTKEGFAEEDHLRLAKLFKELDERGCYCIMTNHDTELIREAYSDYRLTTERVCVRRSINSDPTNRKGMEVIVTNY